MKQMTIIIKPFRAKEVLKALEEMQLTDSCVVREAKGYSRQKGYLQKYVGSEYSEVFLPKVEITVTMEADRVQEVVDKIQHVARTGRMGDGKIFVMSLGWPDAIEF